MLHATCLICLLDVLMTHIFVQSLGLFIIAQVTTMERHVIDTIALYYHREKHCKKRRHPFFCLPLETAVCKECVFLILTHYNSKFLNMENAMLGDVAWGCFLGLRLVWALQKRLLIRSVNLSCL